MRGFTSDDWVALAFIVFAVFAAAWIGRVSVRDVRPSLPKPKGLTINRVTFSVGDRVTYGGDPIFGVVIEVDEQGLKVRWIDGPLGIYKRGDNAENLQLVR
jgi:uncharacterized membrane protein